MQSAVDELEAAQGRPRGIATGFKDLDGLTGGAVAGALWVIAGRSGVGKSVLAVDLARSAAVRQGESTLLVGGSEIPDAVTRRLLAAEARVPLHHMTEGTLSADDWGRLSRRMGEVAESPLVLVQPEPLDLALARIHRRFRPDRRVVTPRCPANSGESILLRDRFHRVEGHLAGASKPRSEPGLHDLR
jgi:replicative DNA helicase